MPKISVSLFTNHEISWVFNELENCVNDSPNLVYQYLYGEISIFRKASKWVAILTFFQYIYIYIYFFFHKRTESLVIDLKIEPSVFNKISGESISCSCPFSNTAILLESKIVFSRCAIVKTVQSANSFFNVAWIKLSVSWSTAAVASSKTIKGYGSFWI